MDTNLTNANGDLNTRSIWVKLGCFGLFCLFLLIVFLIFFKPWSYIENYQLGYKFDKRNGSITVIPHTGYVGRTPIFEAVNTIDLRPRQVCITVGGPTAAGTGSGANARVLNCKLVEFTPGPAPHYPGLALFLSWHGRADYEDSNLDDLLKIYAYDGSGRTYPFLKVLRELKNDDAVPNQVPVGQ
jgi:hypothetical protein